jgi:hypothetical protein
VWALKLYSLYAIPKQSTYSCPVLWNVTHNTSSNHSPCSATLNVFINIHIKTKQYYLTDSYLHHIIYRIFTNGVTNIRLLLRNDNGIQVPALSIGFRLLLSLKYSLILVAVPTFQISIQTLPLRGPCYFPLSTVSMLVTFSC